VGRSFGVVKLTLPNGPTFDFTIHEEIRKFAPGHKASKLSSTHPSAPEEAAARRDFTINSLMFNPEARNCSISSGEESDLRSGILRHTGPAFVERSFTRLARDAICRAFQSHRGPKDPRSLPLDEGELFGAASERVRDEWFKWAAKSTVPSAGLRFLVETE